MLWRQCACVKRRDTGIDRSAQGCDGGEDMRAVQRFPFRKVYFRRTDDTHYIHSILPGIERVTWNTEKRAIAAGVTRPLQVVLVPDVWSEIARRDIPVDDWLVDEREQTEEVDAWVK